MSEGTIVDSIIRRIKNRKILAIFIVAGVSLIGVGSATDAAIKISTFVQKVFGIGAVAAPDIELVNRQLRPVYFDLKVVVPDYVSTIQVIVEPLSRRSQLDPLGRRSELDAEGRKTLEHYANLLKSLSIDYTLLIEGHTSSSTVLTNKVLTKTRAQNVADYLERLGVPREQIRTVSYGGEKWDGQNSPYSEKVEFRVFASK